MLSKKTLIFVLTFLSGVIFAVVWFSFQEPREKTGSDKQGNAEHHDDAGPMLEPGGKGVASNKQADISALQPGAHNGTAHDGKEDISLPVDPRLREEIVQLRKRKVDMAIQALQAPLNVQVPLPRSSSPESAQNTRRERLDGRDDGVEDRPERRFGSVGSEYDPAAQKDKEDFARRSGADGQWTLNASRSPGARYELKSGTILPGIMISGINSDLPGTLLAQVSQNVFDTASGRHLLIPQGSRLFGRYDSRVIMGQERVLIAWNRVILPDGSTLDLGSMPGADQEGYAGFTDSVDNHYMRLFGSAVIMSMITGGMAYSVDSFGNNSNNNNNNTPSVQDEMGSALAATMGQASVSLLNKNMNISPTLEIRPGYRFNLIVVKDISFDAPYKPWK
jgi:type IV secretion system protein VirB10